MAKRGRPRTNGRKPGWMLGRALIAIEAYDRARRDGQKHWFALEAAVIAVRTEFPGVPISQTEVKRVLADLRSKNASEALLVIKHDGVWTFGFGMRPDYRRKTRKGPASNAAPEVLAPIGQIYLD